MPYKDIHVRRVKHRQYSKNWRALNTEKYRKAARVAAGISRTKDPERYRTALRTWRRANLDKDKIHQRRKHLKHLYGITEFGFSVILKGQKNTCAVCRKRKWGPKGPCVDHDHKTGNIRGILCSRCNLGLGHFLDSIDLLEQALTYLKKHRGI